MDEPFKFIKSIKMDETIKFYNLSIATFVSAFFSFVLIFIFVFKDSHNLEESNENLIFLIIMIIIFYFLSIYHILSFPNGFLLYENGITIIKRKRRFINFKKIKTIDYEARYEKKEVFKIIMNNNKVIRQFIDSKKDFQLIKLTHENYLKNVR
jgi:hypothetical protein